MKAIYIIAVLILFAPFLYGQRVKRQNPKKVAPNDTIVPGKVSREDQIRKIDAVKVKMLSDTTGNQPRISALVDTTRQNKYGDLLDDDTAYNKRSPLWVPTVEALGAVTFTWALDRFILNAGYARIGITSWKNNLSNGLEWDTDRFGVNFIGHPYSGTSPGVIISAAVYILTFT